VEYIFNNKVKVQFIENLMQCVTRVLAGAQKKANKIDLDRKVGSGRTAIKSSKTNVKRLKKTLDHSHGISQRMLGQMFGCHHSYVCRTIQRKTSIRYRKKGSVPGRTPQQKSVVRPKCSALVKIFRKKSCHGRRVIFLSE
jgi:hypothetical protein